MIGEDFLRDFFGMPAAQNGPYSGVGHQQAMFSSAVMQRCAELTNGWHPQTNIMPVLEILATAERYGWDVVPRVTSSPQPERYGAGGGTPSNAPANGGNGKPSNQPAGEP